MLPVEVLPLKKEESDLVKLQSVIEKTVGRFVSKREEMSEKRSCLSFMIDDILSGNRDKIKSPGASETSATPSPYCSSSPTKRDINSMPNSCSESFSCATTQYSNRLLPSTPSAFLPTPSPCSTSPRYGYYSPAIAASPPFSLSSRNADIFTFIPSDFNERLNCSYLNMRQENMAHSPLYSPSVILDLSNYVPKSSNSRIPQPPVIAMPSSNIGKYRINS